MALKNRPCSRRSKRLNNVVENVHLKSEEVYVSSSDGESGETLELKKVREGHSVKQLLKNNDNFNIIDHVYSCGKLQKNSFSDVKKTEIIKLGGKRKNSEESDDKPEKQRCFSRNAVMARMNRERKKLYISSLESENKNLRKENIEISRKIVIQNKTILSLKREILYLKGLLANSKELCQILQNLKATTGLPVTSSMIHTTEMEMEMKNEECSKDSLNVKKEAVQCDKMKPVDSGSSFLILDKDVYLGNCSDESLFCSDVPDYENPLFDFDNDNIHSFNSEFFNENLFFNNENGNWDLELESLDGKPRDTLLDDSPQSGICLHVNKKRISVETCVICNSKANSPNLHTDLSNFVPSL